ncbi:hypothetical protein VNO77_32607 [Canavalia gladiata]|uniref:TF-B3 domain-containing protein n=1 Tax=Canavalia gladiata TaxID=3824 RepID=A0AAN9KQV3_CANGL
MGGSNCDGCRSWVEDIYWNHFQFLHFAQFLRTGYDQHLAIPKAFSDNLKKKLPENVSLKGPNGIVWSVGLITRNDTLYFTHGWQQFVKDQFLKENDFLVFKYNGESQFDVLIFDGGSFCEKAGSYFVRKCGHTEQWGEYFNKGKGPDNSLEEGNTPSNADLEYDSPEKSVHLNGEREPVVVPSETPSEKTFNAGVESACLDQVMADKVTELAAVPSQPSTSKKIRKLVSVVKNSQTKRRGRGRPPKVSSSQERDHNWVTEHGPVSVGKSVTYESYSSNRRHVTESEINNALQLAQASCTNDSLLIVMRPTHVYKRFYVSIPGKWIADHISLSSQELVLRMGKGEWLARYSFHSIRRTGGLTGGWKHFALDNNLEEFDVCLFKPAGQMSNIFVMDVTIFRVVDEIVPVTAVTSAKKGRKPAMNAMHTET